MKDKILSLDRYYVNACHQNIALRDKLKQEYQNPDFIVESFPVMSVWYSLLFVVIEGWENLGLQDPEVNRLISDENKVDKLRKFRNGTFHYQEDYFPEKIMAAICEPGFVPWVIELDQALGKALRRLLAD